MSTQLILYPQNYKGYAGSSIALIEYFVDGQNFSDVNASTTTLVTQPSAVQNAIDSISPSMITNTWYRYYTGASVGVSQSGNKLTLEVPNLGPGDTGIIQKLSNLTVGQVYEASVNFSSQFGESAKAYMYSGTVLQSTHNLPDLLLFDTTFQFTAVTTSQSIVINKHRPGLTTGKSIINSISITKQSQPSATITDDGQVICDLYAEEDIPLTLSIDDFKNVVEKVQSYSKDFNLPATKRNNQIFNNMFEVTRADDGLIFNPYVRTKCVLKQDGFILFEGYLRLIDAKEKEGQISYNVNLYSEVIALADILKDATFAELNFDELTHEYNKISITNSWFDPASGNGLPLSSPLSTSSFAYNPLLGVNKTNVLKYPFIDWNHQFTIAAAGGTPTAGNPQLPNLETAFRPCIQLKYLINKIFAAAGFNWTSNFFDSADFEKLFMDFNWGANNAPAQSVSSASNTFYCNGGQGAGYYAGTTYTNFVLDNLGLAYFVFPPNYDYVTNIITATSLNESYNITYKYHIINEDSVTRTVEARYLKNSTEFNPSGVITIAAGDSYNYQGNLNISLDTGDTLQAQFRADAPGVVVQSPFYSSGFGTDVVFITGLTNITSSTILQTLRESQGQWDFLKGIMTMFNLISMVDESNPDNILIEPYADVFINNTNGGPGNLTLKDRGIQHDWTEKVDASEMELKPLTDLNLKTVFKFVEDDDDYCFNVFKQAQSGHLYGSLVHQATGFTILEGTEEITAEPFAATVSKPIGSSFTSFIIPSLYAMNDDGTCEGFDNSPRIFYNNGIKPTGASYYIPAQNGGTSANETEFLQFSHLSDVPVIISTRDFVFESSQLPLDVAPAGPPVDNLYNTYWAPYFNELYNADTRTMTLKVNLSPSDVAAFKFYDTVMIKNRSFRVNKIQYKPNSLATVEFILIP